MTRSIPTTFCIAFLLGLPGRVAADERLAFEVSAEGSEIKLFVADAEGKNPRFVAYGDYADMSADGSQVSYIERSGEIPRREGGLLVTRNLENGLIEQWTATKGFYVQTDVSRNGRYLTISGDFGTRPKGAEWFNQVAIYDTWKIRSESPSVVSQDGKRTIYQAEPELIKTDHAAYFPELSSDGRFVVFHQSIGRDPKTHRAKKKWITLYDRRKKTFKNLTNTDGYCFSPAMSFDDRYVSFTCRVVEEKTENDDVYMVDLKNPAAPKVRITRHPGHDWASTFRRDGRIAFASDRDGHLQLYEARSDDGTWKSTEVRPLVTGEGKHYAPSFSGHAVTTRAKANR